MSEALEWFKSISSFIKDNKWLVVWLLGAIGGMAGSVTQYFEVEAKEQEKNKAVREVATAFQAMIPADKPAEPIKVDASKILKECKSYCDLKIKNHENGVGGWH